MESKLILIKNTIEEWIHDLSTGMNMSIWRHTISSYILLIPNWSISVVISTFISISNCTMHLLIAKRIQIPSIILIERCQFHIKIHIHRFVQSESFGTESLIAQTVVKSHELIGCICTMKILPDSMESFTVLKGDNLGTRQIKKRWKPLPGIWDSTRSQN